MTNPFEKTTSGVRVFPDGPRAPGHGQASTQAPETVVPKSVSEPKIAPLVIETEAVKPVEPPALRTDGPTLAEWVAAGYVANNYPPSGYAPKAPANPAPVHINRHGRQRPGPLNADSEG